MITLAESGTYLPSAIVYVEPGGIDLFAASTTLICAQNATGAISATPVDMLGSFSDRCPTPASLGNRYAAPRSAAPARRAAPKRSP